MANHHNESGILLVAMALVALTGAAPQSSQLYLGGGLTILTQNLLDGKLAQLIPPESFTHMYLDTRSLQ